jgi:hypothetical protein
MVIIISRYTLFNILYMSMNVQILFLQEDLLKYMEQSLNLF